MKKIERLTPHLDKVLGLTDQLSAARDRRNNLAHTFCFDWAPYLTAPATRLTVDDEIFLGLFAEVQEITRGLMGRRASTAPRRRARDHPGCFAVRVRARTPGPSSPVSARSISTALSVPHQLSGTWASGSAAPAFLARTLACVDDALLADTRRAGS